MNYLLIGCDQLRYDSLSCHGNEVCKTPNLDKLAKMGMDFQNAHSTAPLCSPARASLFTGQYALSHGMGTNCDMYHSLSEELFHPENLLHNKMISHNRKCGYVGKWHVGTNLGPCDFGFEGMNVPGYGNCKKEKEYLQYLEDNQLSYTLKNPTYLNPGDKTLASAIWDGSDESTTDWFLTNKAMSLMDQYQENKQDYFLSLQYWGPHGPHTPPISWVGKADRNLIEPWKNYHEALDDKPGFVKRHLSFYRDSPKDWEGCREVIGLYYDYLMFIDSQIGRVLSYLEKHNLMDSTTIAFTSDHGDMQWSHGGLIDKGFLYEEAMHIPLLYYKPHMNRGIKSDAIVSLMDILPTFLDDMGIGIQNERVHRDGRSFNPILEGKSEGREEYYMEFHGIHFLYSQRAVLSKNGWKYIWSPGDVHDELYYLPTDPCEMNNLCNDKNFEAQKNGMIQKLKECSVRHRDPVMDYVYKIFGEWKSPSGQVDATSLEYSKSL